MKVLITGGAGQLGRETAEALLRRGFEVKACSRAACDVTQKKQTAEQIREYAPDWVIHCASYTKVDLAEEEQEECRLLNADGTRNVAEACLLSGARLLYFSTDYVFDGEKEGRYEVTDMPGPLNVYGQTKYEGEQIVRERLKKSAVVRISWLYGKYGNNFVKTMLRLGAEREAVRVVSDQVGAPTYAKDVAEYMPYFLERELYGTYHLTNGGACSFAEFAQEIFRQAGMGTRVIPISAEEYAAKARRPKNSRLSPESLTEKGLPLLSDWKDALRRFLEELNKV